MLTIGDAHMVCDQTPHTARWSPDAAANGEGAWVVSWLPQRLLTRNQAITAMTLAEVVASEPPAPTTRWWPFIEDWAEELCLTARHAIDILTAVPA